MVNISEIHDLERYGDYLLVQTSSVKRDIKQNSHNIPSRYGTRKLNSYNTHYTLERLLLYADQAKQTSVGYISLK